MNGDETRAEALHAGEVLVAGGLVDLALAPELGFDRHHRQAVRLLRAIAAAFADLLVDHHPLRRIDHDLALPAAALLGGAGLVVDQDAGALDLAKLALDAVQIVAMLDPHSSGKPGRPGILLRLVRDDDDARSPFRRELATDHRHRQRAVMGLTAGHGDRVVVEDLVRDIDARRDCGADRQNAGVEVRPVAEIGEDMLLVGERRLTDPGHAFAAHLGKRLRPPVHPRRHVMAADAGHGAAALGDHGGGVMRAAGAEERLPLHQRLPRLGVLLPVEELDAAADAFMVEELQQAAADRHGDAGRRQLVIGRQQLCDSSSNLPITRGRTSGSQL